MAYRIEASECIGCGSCEEVCPVGCISEINDEKRFIDEENCTSCGSCAEICPVECIFEVEE